MDAPDGQYGGYIPFEYPARVASNWRDGFTNHSVGSAVYDVPRALHEPDVGDPDVSDTDSDGEYTQPKTSPPTLPIAGCRIKCTVAYWQPL